MTEHDDRVPAEEWVLVSGIEIEVSNPELAASLRAAGGTTAEIDEIVAVDQRTVAEALPDAVVALQSPRSHAEQRSRCEFRARVAAAGAALGFEVASDGAWHSASGVVIVTRSQERPLTPAAAVSFVTEIAPLVREEYERGAVLFVVAHRESAEAFAIAIRNRHVGDSVRTISLPALERLVGLAARGAVTHDDVVSVLAPVAGADAGSLVGALVRAHAHDEDSSADRTAGR